MRMTLEKDIRQQQMEIWESCCVNGVLRSTVKIGLIIEFRKKKNVEGGNKILSG